MQIDQDFEKNKISLLQIGVYNKARETEYIPKIKLNNRANIKIKKNNLK